MKVKSIDKTKMKDPRAKKRAQQYQEIMEQWKANFIIEINKARETSSRKGPFNPPKKNSQKFVKAGVYIIFVA